MRMMMMVMMMIMMNDDDGDDDDGWWWMMVVMEDDGWWWMMMNADDDEDVVDDVDDGDGDGSGDGDDERKMMMRMFRRRMKMLMLRRKTGPETRKHTLCEPAQSKCTWTLHQGKVADAKNPWRKPQLAGCLKVNTVPMNWKKETNLQPPINHLPSDKSPPVSLPGLQPWVARSIQPTQVKQGDDTGIGGGSCLQFLWLLVWKAQTARYQHGICLLDLLSKTNDMSQQLSFCA